MKLSYPLIMALIIDVEQARRIIAFFDDCKNGDAYRDTIFICNDGLEIRLSPCNSDNVKLLVIIGTDAEIELTFIADRYIFDEFTLTFIGGTHTCISFETE